MLELFFWDKFPFEGIFYDTKKFPPVLPTPTELAAQESETEVERRAERVSIENKSTKAMISLGLSEKRKKDLERSSNRRSQIGTGDRSERIRTYNFPQGRVTDHRINLTLHKLEEFMEGEIFDEIVENLSLHAQEEELKNLEK